MGPAYLEDVIGIDTGSHVSQVISQDYPQRMPPTQSDPLKLMAEHQRFGQKTGLGFYRYAKDPSGKPQKMAATDSHALLERIQPNGRRDFSDNEIIERMMLPLIVEAACALEDGIVATAGELDMALLLGIGFPQYLGGPLLYADWLGLDELVRLSDKYSALGPQFHVPATLRTMAADRRSYYGNR